ncbi:MAG: 30S ribosomal protein S5 [Alphaproteobacteria bacterium]|nr:30S ribosomal protein S5 [Alphaproteobacteria bacterium]
MAEESGKELIEKLVSVRRVAKVVKGGKNFSFSALMVVGDGQGNVGYATGKAREVPEAIKKATRKAQDAMVHLALREGRTLHHPVKFKLGAGRVVILPANPGTGLIAGGAMRAVLEAAGVQDVVGKAVGSRTPHSLLRATIAALQTILSPRQMAQKRRKSVSFILGKRPSQSDAPKKENENE